ncbi:MAG TPA: hypothetical protein VHS59_00615, partial [Bacillota bacterium]|nr:hypothetical protein [Bacillota bacterium]
ERDNLTLLEQVIRDGIRPLQQQVMGATTAVTGFFSDVWHLGNVVQERKRLNQEVVQLKARVLELQEMEYQNLRLRQLLNFKEQTKNQYRLDLPLLLHAFPP